MSEGHGLRISRPSKRVVLVEWDDGDPRDFLLRSDAHCDNAQCDDELELAHLREARRRGAGILDFGDLFDVMGGKWDPRASPKHARPEFHGQPYLDAVENFAADRYEPFAPWWILMSPGNHESQFNKRHEMDLTSRLAARLNERTGSSIQRGPYAGWVVFRSRQGQRQYHTLRLRYVHGYGGGGPVTKGTIQTNRRAVYLPDADLVVSGHIHERWTMTIPRERISSTGLCYQDAQLHVSIPSYKREHDDGDGWAIEKGLPPKPLGAWWLRLVPTTTKRLTGTSANILRPELSEAA